ncbi:hypothetical protein EDD11_000004 [Mortierella claussenii]|nr:hypothetical protein EDD11_000004 [Mortierella claussenii]
MGMFSPQPGIKAEVHPAKELWNEDVLATAKGNVPAPETGDSRRSPRCGMGMFSPQPGIKAEVHPAKELWNEDVLATAKGNVPAPETGDPRRGLCCGMGVFSPQPGIKAEVHPAKELWNEDVLATAKGNEPAPETAELGLVDRINRYPKDFASYPSIKETLGLFLFRHNLLDVTEIVLESGVQKQLLAGSNSLEVLQGQFSMDLSSYEPHNGLYSKWKPLRNHDAARFRTNVQGSAFVLLPLLSSNILSG